MKIKTNALLLLLGVLTLTSCRQSKLEMNQEDLQFEERSVSAINPGDEEKTIEEPLDLESKINEVIDKRLRTIEVSEETKKDLVDDICFAIEEDMQATIDSAVAAASISIERNITSNISSYVLSETSNKVNSAIETAINGEIQSRIDQAIAQIEPTVTNITNVIQEERPQTVVDGTSISCNPGETFDWNVNYEGDEYNFHINSFKAKIYNVDFSEISKSSEESKVYSKYKVHITYTGTTDPSLQNKTVTFATMSGLGSIGDSVSGATIGEDGSFSGEKEISLNFMPDSINFMSITVRQFSLSTS